MLAWAGRGVGVGEGGVYRVAVDVFGDAVHDDVGAEVERVLHVGA